MDKAEVVEARRAQARHQTRHGLTHARQGRGDVAGQFGALRSALRTSMPELRLLCLSMHDREPYISEALRRGVHGYVTKGAATDELVAAMRALCNGEIYLSSDLQRPRPSGPVLERLSDREREVFLLVARGRKAKQVAATLGISDKTVYLHRATVRAKLGARDDLELHRIALERGLL